MELIPCSQCLKTRTALTCGICGCSICKYCAQITDADSFSFLKEMPEELKHGTYCGPCYDDKVAGQLADYKDVLERAKNIDVFFKNQGKETRLVKRKEKPIEIAACDDRDEVIMRLAFLTALANYNAVVDVDLISEKVGKGSYQKLQWRGVGIPVQVKGNIIVTDKSIWHNPN